MLTRSVNQDNNKNEPRNDAEKLLRRLIRRAVSFASLGVVIEADVGKIAEFTASYPDAMTATAVCLTVSLAATPQGFHDFMRRRGKSREDWELICMGTLEVRT